MPYLIVISVGL